MFNPIITWYTDGSLYAQYSQLRHCNPWSVISGQ